MRAGGITIGGAHLERWAARPPLRYAIVLGYDAAATLCGLYGALLLLGEVPHRYSAPARVAAPLLVFLRIATVCAAGLHRWSFRMSGLSEAARLVAAMFAATVVLAVAAHGLPASVVALEFFLTTSLMAAFRFAPRLLEGWSRDRAGRGSTSALRTVIVGAGGTGDLLARDLQRSAGSKYYVVGFVDDNPTKSGMHVSGKPVLGAIADLPRIIAAQRITTVLLAIPSLPAQRIRGILALCASCKASFKTIPASYARLDERISAAMLHDLSPDDLLPREPIAFDPEEIRALVAGRSALVTGAGGSIGGEICRQLARHGVTTLVMVDMNENELYLLARRLRDDHPALVLHTEVADIRDLTRMRRLGSDHHPDLVFHAAAHKHVPLMEEAPEEAVKNNVFGTLNVALLAHESGAEKLVVISTDKAVNPTSVMGATKRIAELVVRDLARRSCTQMTAVRFGNVLGSAGSVVPLFKQQIERGGPVTVTHPDCTRYFMTVSEAVGLVLLAALKGYGDLCVLDMGEPIKIAEMASNLITMAGRIPGIEIPIVFTGLRPGEKLYEELLTEEEEHTAQVRDRIHVARSPPPPDDLARSLHELQELAHEGDREGVLEVIGALVPTYRRTPGDLPWRPVPSRPTPVERPLRAVSGASAAACAAVAPADRDDGAREPPRSGVEWLHSPFFR